MSNQQNPIASRYAEALFEWATEEGASSNTLSALMELEQVFDGIDNLYVVMSNPTMARDAKHGMFADALKSVSPAVLNMIQLLIEHDRFVLFPDVVSTFQTLVDKQEKRARGEVITATPIDDALLNTIAEQLKKTAGFEEVHLTNMVNPDLLGGAVLQLGDQRVDGSFASQLNKLVTR